MLAGKRLRRGGESARTRFPARARAADWPADPGRA